MGTKTNSIVAKTLATSVLFASCTPNADLEQLTNEETDNNLTNDILSSKGVSISLSLDEKTRQSLHNLAPLVQEIIENPQTAKEFSIDPVNFCQQRGYTLYLNPNDAIFKIIAALGDYDINEALKNNDFERFIQACTKLNLLDKEQKVNLNTIFKSSEEQEIFNAIAYELNGETIESRSVAMWVVVSVVVVVAIIVTYTVGMSSDSVSQMQAQNVPSDSIVYNYYNKQQSRLLRSPNPNFAVLDIWALKNKSIKDYQLIDRYKNIFIEQLVAYLHQEKPHVFEKFSDLQITEFLKRNIIV